MPDQFAKIGGHSVDPSGRRPEMLVQTQRIHGEAHQGREQSERIGFDNANRKEPEKQVCLFIFFLKKG